MVQKFNPLDLHKNIHEKLKEDNLPKIKPCKKISTTVNFTAANSLPPEGTEKSLK